MNTSKNTNEHMKYNKCKDISLLEHEIKLACFTKLCGYTKGRHDFIASLSPGSAFTASVYNCFDEGQAGYITACGL